MPDTAYEEALVRAVSKQGYIEKFLKLDDQVVMMLSMAFLFNNQQETPALEAITELVEAQEE